MRFRVKTVNPETGTETISIRDGQKLEITKMLTVSTAHVSKELFENLVLDDACRHICLPVYKKTVPGFGSVGVYIYIDPGAFEDREVPYGLLPLVKLAQGNGCSVLCLDSDGPVVEGYPVFDW